MDAIQLPDENVAQYSLQGLVKYSIYSQYISLINIYSQYKSTNNEAYKNRIVSMMRNIALLCVSAFGGAGKDAGLVKFANWHKFVKQIPEEKTNQEILNEIQLDKTIFELSRYLNAKNVTDVSPKKLNMTDAFARG